MYNPKTKLYGGYIYSIKNTITGMMYVGQTSTSILTRWRSHVSCSKSGKECHLHLHRSIRKYGKSSFEVKEVEAINAPSPEKLKDMLNAREKHYIIALNTLSPSGYNMTDGGDATAVSVKRGVYKVSGDGKVLAHYSSIREAGIENGFLPTLINRACMSNNHFSHDFFWFYDSEYVDSPSQIDIPLQISCGNKQGSKIGGKSVLQFSKNGEYIQSFPSAKDAAAFVGVSEDKVAVCCRRNRDSESMKYTSGGYRWMYAADFN